MRGRAPGPPLPAAARCPPFPAAAQHRGTRTNGQKQRRPSSRPPSHRHPPPKKAGFPLPKTIAHVISCAQRFHLRGGAPMASFDARPAGNGITRRTMTKTSAVLIGSCARFHRRHLARMQRGQQRRRRFLRRVRPGNAARRWPALLHQRRRRGNRVLGRGAFPGPEPCRRHHSALLSQWRKPRFLLLDVGAAWVPCHRDGNAAHAQRRRRELRRRRFHPT